MESPEVVKIKFQKQYSTYRPGDVVECDDEVAHRLIADGRAVPERQGQLVEMASIEPAGESTNITPRRRGRPPKEKHLEIPQSEDADSSGR